MVYRHDASERDWLLVGHRLSERVQHLQRACTTLASKTGKVGSRNPPPSGKWARVSSSSGTGPCPHFARVARDPARQVFKAQIEEERRSVSISVDVMQPIGQRLTLNFKSCLLAVATTTQTHQ